MPTFTEGHKKVGGRKKGTPNKASARREAEIAATGLTPLEFMLNLLRDEGASEEDRRWAAEKAAPYVHPKLANVQHGGSIGTGKVSVGKPHPGD